MSRYVAKINGTTFFDTSVSEHEYALTSATLELPTSFKFTIPLHNSAYNSVKELTDYVDVFKDDDLIFTGRILTIKALLEGQKEVLCEYASAFLNDSILIPQKFENTTNHDVFRSFITNHNSQVNAEKQIEVGRITVSSAACYRDYQKIETTIKRINDLVDSYGGRVEVIKRNGAFYIDWLEDYDDSTNQSIDFGSNLLSIESVKVASDIITALIPLGAKDNSKNNITVSQANGGSIVVFASQENINKYGIIYGTKTWDDVTDAINLKRKASEYLEALCADRYSIKVKAVDLKDAGYSVDAFRVGQKIKVKSARHNIDRFFDCKKMKIDIFDIASNELELGEETTSLTSQNKNSSDGQIKLIEEIERNYATVSDLETAIENATNMITSGHDGYVVMHDANNDGHPDEILIMDESDIDTAVKIWRWNENGLGYSNEGYDGNYETAMTADGQIVADMITAGTLNGSIIKTGRIQAQQGNTYWDLDTGIFYFGDAIENDKSKVYVHTPEPPYYVGDIYITDKDATTSIAGLAIAGKAIAGKTGQLNVGGTVYVCLTSRLEGSFNSADWTILTNYVDFNEVEALKGQIQTAYAQIEANMYAIDAKASSQSVTDLATRVTDAELEINGLSGEIASKVSTQTFNEYKNVVANTYFTQSASELAFEAVYNEIDQEVAKKSRIFRQTPFAPYSIGDLWLTTSLDSFNGFAGIAVAGKAIAGWGNDIYACTRAKTTGNNFDINDWEKASDYVSESQLDLTIQKINSAELRIDAANAQIQTKVSTTDYNGATIASMINQTPESIVLEANKIGLSGSEIKLGDALVVEDGKIRTENVTVYGHDTVTFTEADRTRVQGIVNGSINPTQQDYEKYDLNGDGKISSLDYVVIANAITNKGGVYSSVATIDPNAIRKTISIEDNLGYSTDISPLAVATNTLIGKRLVLDQPLFKIKEIHKDLTISGDPNQQYWAEGSIEVTADNGYEIVGSSGFAIESINGSKPYMMSVYKAAIRQSSNKYYFDYGLTNTGVNQQKVRLKFYLMEALTKDS